MYEIGPFRRDPEAQVLTQDGAALPLGSRAVAVLSALVRRPNEHVQKSDIIEAAWPGVVVEESNLAVQISSIRRVLARAPGGERWIETLSRRGYRFVGPVAVVPGLPAEQRTNLQRALTSFVGRERELAALAAWAAEVRDEGESRWVRVVGPAGIGKTRLVQELRKRESDVVPADDGPAPHDHPVLVVATARESQIDARWQELRLAPLLRKAAERLAAHLVPDATPDAIAHLVERAAGNPRHLELLAAAGGDAPEALLAEVQAELDALPQAARRLLRAASVLGQRFSREGLCAIAGDAAVASFLDHLVACEVLERSGDELAFRRPLVWEAARATLTDDDRALAERLAAHWRATR
jgi:DNA-binding winged helix-turn-helix (wHTH) protein